MHILSPNAAEYITEAALYIKYGKTVMDISDTIHVFPTYAEAVKLSAQAFFRSLKLMSVVWNSLHSPRNALGLGFRYSGILPSYPASFS